MEDEAILNETLSPKFKNYGVAKDLEPLDFPTDIKLKANNLYIAMKLGQKRDKKRRMAVTFSIYQTYLDEGLYYDIVHIGNKVGLTPEQSNASIPAYSIYLFASGKSHHKGDVDIKVMIDYYCGETVLNFDEGQIEEIKDQYELCVERGVKQGYSKKVFIAALIYYWLKSKSTPIDDKKYVKSFPGVTLGNVTNIYNQIIEKLRT